MSFILYDGEHSAVKRTCFFYREAKVRVFPAPAPGSESRSRGSALLASKGTCMHGMHSGAHTRVFVNTHIHTQIHT